MTVKSQRVLKELTRNVSNQANLHAKNNDECYTSMHDIGAELGRWIELGKLEGKRIFCQGLLIGPQAEPDLPLLFGHQLELHIPGKAMLAHRILLPLIGVLLVL